MARIPVAGPWITQREVDYVADATANAWYERAGEYNERFERAFAEYLGVAHVMSLPSCTSAIHLALLALGIGPGDEVVVPDATWIASAAPVSYVGATTVFADIEPDTWCLSASSFEASITPRTRAVIPVELYGSMPDWKPILEIAKKNGIHVIEDSAEAIGSKYDGQIAGSFGDVGVFSFHGSKTLTTGEGGLLATNLSSVFERAQVLRDHGRAPGDRFFENKEVAYKYKMSALQAALGLAQLERVGELVDQKRKIFTWYRDELGTVEGVVLNAEPANTLNSCWMTTVVIDEAYGLDKRAIMAELSAHGIDSRPFFSPLSSLAAYGGSEQAVLARTRNKVSHDIGRRAVNLPSALRMEREQVRYVCDALKAILRNSRRDRSGGLPL